ncbi:MAG: ECF transporter S component [Clostridia bacterium]|nr:ECF transporter S component [Clostridia bacterium]
MNRSSVRRLTMAAMMGAVAFVLMYFSFSVPVLSPFADFDFSYLPELIGGFILGPVGAVEIIAVKILLKLVFKGTSTMLTGELQKFLLSCAYVLPAVLYYRRHRTKRGAVVGLVIGTVVGVVVAIITNVYIIFPFYIKLYGMDWAAIIDMCNAVNPYIHDLPTMVAFSIIPFNLISMTVISLIAVLVYKKISVPLKKMIQ